MKESVIGICFVIFTATIIVNEIYYFFGFKFIDQANEIQRAQQNLMKNYIWNVRMINGDDNCEKDEAEVSTVVSKGEKNYTLNEISLKKSYNNSTLIKLCYEVHYQFNFDYLSKNQQDTNLLDDQTCRYNGISFKPDEKLNICPISDIIFSNKDEEIDGYEKAENKNDNGLNIFFKRSDENLTPLIEISIIRSNRQSYLQTSMNLTFTLAEICKEKYVSYVAICQSDDKQDEFEYTVVKENQIALDQQCHNQLLTFDKGWMIDKNLNQTFLELNFLFLLSIIIVCCLFISYTDLDRSNSGLRAFIIIYYIIKAILIHVTQYSIINDGLNSIEQNCYRNSNPLEFLLHELRIHWIIILIIEGIIFSPSFFMLIVILVTLIKILVNNVKCPNFKKYKKFSSNQEMAQV